VAAKAVIAGQDIGGDRRVRSAEMGDVVDVVNGRRYVKARSHRARRCTPTEPFLRRLFCGTETVNAISLSANFPRGSHALRDRRYPEAAEYRQLRIAKRTLGSIQYLAEDRRLQQKGRGGQDPDAARIDHVAARGQ